MRSISICKMAALRLSVMGVVLLGGFSLQAQAGIVDPAITLVVNAFNPDGTPLNQLVPGDEVVFQVGIVVDPTYIPPNQTGGTGNLGLTSLVYNVFGQEAGVKGYQLNQMEDAFSGFSNTGLDVGDPGVGDPADVHNDFFSSSNNAISANYGGGWGFNRAGLPGGGTVTNTPGTIEAAGAIVGLTWTADTHPNLPGEQPVARQGVGIGAFTFGADDPVLSGVQGGFGFSIAANTITPGDGTWIVQEGVIDTTDWDLQKYTFEVLPTVAGVFNGTLDYTQDISGGFNLLVPLSVDGFPTGLGVGDTFNFTLVPEPSTLAALTIAGLGLVRRRRATKV